MSEQSAVIESSVIDDAKATSIAYGNRDWDRVRAALLPASEYDEVATHKKVKGIEQIMAIWRGWATALPDSRATIEREIASGNTVTLELTWRGTHTGPLQLPSGTIAPTGRSIELRACQIVEVEGGKTRSITQYFDMATLMRQLGL
jgi:steroid delta-isomerase-like uncharacterized protein